jgi:predicted lipase
MNMNPKLGALNLDLKVLCDFNPTTWMNMSIDEWFHMDECHFHMDNFIYDLD